MKGNLEEKSVMLLKIFMVLGMCLHSYCICNVETIFKDIT